VILVVLKYDMEMYRMDWRVRKLVISSVTIVFGNCVVEVV
jgi:hypothetical protein